MSNAYEVLVENFNLFA